MKKSVLEFGAEYLLAHLKDVDPIGESTEDVLQDCFNPSDGFYIYTHECIKFVDTYFNDVWDFIEEVHEMCDDQGLEYPEQVDPYTYVNFYIAFLAYEFDNSIEWFDSAELTRYHNEIAEEYGEPLHYWVDESEIEEVLEASLDLFASDDLLNLRIETEGELYFDEDTADKVIAEGMNWSTKDYLMHQLEKHGDVSLI